MHGSAEAQAAEQAVVQHALTRGWLSQEQLRAALLLQHRLAGEGRPTGLLPLLGRVLPPAHLPELTRVWQATTQDSARTRTATGPIAGPPAGRPDFASAAGVSERLLRESSELCRRPPEQDPEPVQRFMEESRRGAWRGDGSSPTAPAPMPGGGAGSGVPARLGGYRVVREVARGGMGIVYEAHALGLDRRVALKVLRGDPDQEDLARFLREARAAARLRHAGIVGVHEVGEDAGVHFIAMDFVQGPSLKARIQGEGPLPPPEAARIALRVAEALQHAHEHGVLHRDVKPHNVLLDELSGGQAVLGDFGLAKEVDRGDGLTHTGAAMGTPAYMAPEQVEGRPADARTDVWGLGVTLYEMLAACPPFRATTPVGMAQAVLRDDPAPPSRWRAGIPLDLETVCLKCLEKEPARRYRSAGELAHDLRRFLADEPVSARRAGAGQRLRRWVRRQRVALISAGLALGVGAGALLVREHVERTRAREAAEARRADVERLLERARSQGLSSEEARTGAVFQLARLLDAPALERLCAELEGVTGELRAAELAVYQAAAEPDAQERARGEEALLGLEAALAARHPGETLPREEPQRGLVEAAARRLEERARRSGAAGAREAGAPAPPSALELVARAQTQRLGRRADVARLCCEVLARAEEGQRAGPALAAYLAAEADPSRAAAAAVALAHLGDEEQLRPVLASLDRFDARGPFSGPVKRALAARERGPAGDQGDLRALLVRGELRQVAHDWRGAREAYDEALALDPRCAEAWRRRGEARLRLRDETGALADSDHALELAPKDPLAWVARASVRIALKDLDGALADATQAVELAPHQARVWRARAHVRSERKDREGALADATRAVELDPRDALSWALRGEARHELKDPGALADLERALELEPGHPGAWRLRARIRMEQGDLAAALADYHRALELDPTNVSAWVNRGAVRIKLGDHVGAQGDLTRAIELDPENAEAWDNRARSRYLQGDMPAAVSDATRALELRPTLARPWCTRGVANLQQKRLREALADLDRAVELSPDEADVWSNRAAAHLQADDLPAARRDLDRAVALAPDEPSVWINRGRVRREQQDLRGALEDFSRAIGLAPKSPQAWEDRGKLRAAAGDLPGGIEDLEQALRLDLSDGQLYFDYALLLIRQGDYPRARKALDEVLLRDKRMAEAWGTRAGLSLIEGQTAQALEDYRRFLELAPDHPEAPAVRALLAEHGQGGAGE